VNNTAPENQRASRVARLVLVDDHPLVRERLADVINREPDLKICGEAEDRFTAVEVIKASNPDLVLVDITLKDSNGMELIRDISARWPGLRMLVISMHDEGLYAERVIRNGAHGFITKQQATRDILVAIRRVLEGNIYVSEAIASRMLNRINRPEATPRDTPSTGLTERETQVFELIGRGLHTGQIAERMAIGTSTVETYRARIKEKLNLQEGELLQRAIAWVHRG
jgi:DNA-binding NarL/FixJ family response regulator